MSKFSEDFKLISYKRHKAKITQPNKVITSTGTNFSLGPTTKPDNLKRINAAKEDLLTSDFYISVRASLREAAQLLHEPAIEKIVCFGLGNIEECMVARYQLAFLLCLRDLYKVQTYVYDPIHGCEEKELLATLSINVLKTNCEGKYRINNNTTLFYLPHCPKQLTNNLLWANWGLQLNYCIIISNSFNKIVETNVSRVINENSQYILSILPYVTELPIINCFKYFDIFNDTAVHLFPQETISLVSQDLWEYCQEPTYSDLDTEFIRS